YSAAGLALDQLRLQLRGGEGISRHGPVDLNTARSGDSSVRATAIGRDAINQLCEQAFGGAIPVVIHERRYFGEAQRYVSVVEPTDSKRPFLLATAITTREISNSEVSAWQRIAIGVSELLEAGII